MRLVALQWLQFCNLAVRGGQAGAVALDPRHDRSGIKSSMLLGKDGKGFHRLRLTYS